MAEQFLGEIRMLPYRFAPRGWAPCDGQLLPISQNTALFTLLGITFGGNGRTTFALPNLQGRLPVGLGAGIDLGEIGGELSHTLTPAEMPEHFHQAAVDLGTASGRTPPGPQTILGQSVGSPMYGTDGHKAMMNESVISPSSGSWPHENRMPYLTLMFCIAMTGLFPQRG